MKQTVDLVSRGDRLHAALVAPARTPAPGSAPAILFVHGLESDSVGYVHRAERAARDLGAVCLAFDLSGHGRSEPRGGWADRSPAEHLADAVAAYDRLVSEPAVAADRVGVCGASYGGYLAALLSRHRAIARMLLRAPAVIADEDLPRSLGSRRRTLSGRDASALLSALSAYRDPLLLVQSERDDVIPAETLDWYAAAAPQAGRVVMAGAPHALTDPRWQAEFLDLIVEFFGPL